MKENKKKKLFMIGMSVLLILIVVIGGTYAWFTLQLNGTKVNVLKAGTLSLILNDENSVGINSEKAVPMLDEVGETLDPYHFTLENHSDIASDYTIYLDDIDLETDEVRMSDSKVKYQLVKDGTKTMALLNTLGENPNRILDSGTIDGNKTITYDLRLWISSDATNEVMGTTLRTKIRVVATQSQQQAEKGPSETNKNILALYEYNATNCITGEEETCTKIETAPETYTPGTIVKYQVNDSDVKYFHVISENKEKGTLTLQQRENTIYATKWYDGGDNSKGPLTVLPALENAAAGWTNVNDQTYTMGTTVFKTNAFTGCYFDLSNGFTCNKNAYTLEERVGKARMITVQEAESLGCKYEEPQSCPNWMNNYLYDSTSSGGTVNVTGGEYGGNGGYWTMQGYESNSAIAVDSYGCFSPPFVDDNGSGGTVPGSDNLPRLGARAVVVINK